MKGLRITAKVANFRRAGLAHPDYPVDYPATRFTAAQIAALKAERMLVVQDIDLPDAPAEQPEKAEKAEK